MAHGKTRLHKDETDRLREEFDNLRTDFASLARELKAYVEHEEHLLGDRVLGGRTSDRVVALKQAGAHQLDLAKRYAADAGKAAETTLRDHPGYVVAGAAALGFLVGAFALRRR
ncbi:MAG: hypothetical protein KDK11_16670 [Maritimibacter sp.]|nr:hypothetical protein [Maritimibacter sp.]